MSRKIILMRHGQPKLAATDKMSALEMKDWIEQYDSSDITKHPVPEASKQLAATAKVIVSSNLPRALTSVQALGLKPALVDGLFREAPLPYGHWRLPRLSPFVWAFILRILWLWVSAPRSAPVFRTIRSSHLTSSFLHRGFSYDYATT